MFAMDSSRILSGPYETILYEDSPLQICDPGVQEPESRQESPMKNSTTSNSETETTSMEATPEKHSTLTAISICESLAKALAEQRFSVLQVLGVSDTMELVKCLAGQITMKPLSWEHLDLQDRPLM